MHEFHWVPVPRVVGVLTSLHPARELIPVVASAVRRLNAPIAPRRAMDPNALRVHIAWDPRVATTMRRIISTSCGARGPAADQAPVPLGHSVNSVTIHPAFRSRSTLQPSRARLVPPLVYVPRHCRPARPSWLKRQPSFPCLPWPQPGQRDRDRDLGPVSRPSTVNPLRIPPSAIGRTCTSRGRRCWPVSANLAASFRQALRGLPIRPGLGPFIPAKQPQCQQRDARRGDGARQPCVSPIRDILAGPLPWTTGSTR